MPTLNTFNRPLTLGCLTLMIITLAGCGGDRNETAESTDPSSGTSTNAADAQAAAQDTAADEKTGKDEEVQEVDIARARQLVQQKQDLLVLDIRTPDEYTDGHIAGAKNIDFYGEGFEKKLRDLKKDQPILLHCASGGRSAKARDLMHSMGFNNLYHMGGGMNAWLDAEYPVKKPDETGGSGQ